MNDLITIPTVEQINLEHQLANSKAAEAVQHATNCGLMLLQVKANLSHGEWLPWLNGEIESGRLQVKIRQAQSYMQLAPNTQRAAYLTEAPSIRAALELLSDREPNEEQTPLIPVDVEAERQARIAAEQQAETERRARAEAEQRARESQQESNERRLKIRGLETHIEGLERRIDVFDGQPKPEPEPVKVFVEKIIEKPVIPPEFATLEQAIAVKQRELDRLNQDTQSALQRNSTVYESRERLQREVDDLTLLLSKHKASEREMVEHQRLTGSAAHFAALFLADMQALEHVPNPEQTRRWEQAGSQFSDLALAVQDFLNRNRAPVAVIQGELA